MGCFSSVGTVALFKEIMDSSTQLKTNKSWYTAKDEKKFTFQYDIDPHIQVNKGMASDEDQCQNLNLNLIKHLWNDSKRAVHSRSSEWNKIAISRGA